MLTRKNRLIGFRIITHQEYTAKSKMGTFALDAVNILGRRKMFVTDVIQL